MLTMPLFDLRGRFQAINDERDKGTFEKMLLQLAARNDHWPDTIETLRWAGMKRAEADRTTSFGWLNCLEIRLKGREEPLILHYGPLDSASILFLKGRPDFREELQKMISETSRVMLGRYFSRVETCSSHTSLKR